MNEPQTISTGAGVRWEAPLLEASLDEAVAAWRDSLHGFAKRLAPRERARFLLALDSAVYPFQGEAALAAEGGLHPKHRILGYHDFFVARIRPGQRVIDLGCGVGALAASIAERSQALVTGVDWNDRNLMKARTLCDSRKVLPAPRFVEDDITTYRVEGAFDVVVLSNVLEHVKDRPRLLRTWREWYGAERFLIRVPAFDRDWRVAYKKELGVEWRCDDTHEIEHTRGQLERELGEAGLAIAELQCRWGEYLLEAHPATPDAAPIREHRERASQEAPLLSREEYVKLQLDRSLALKDHDPGERTRYLIRRLGELVAPGPSRRVLCVGCRNGRELDYLGEAGYTNVTGVDLHSTDPRITVMDMHHLSFEDGTFGIVFAAHVLEHALEPKQAAREMVRVTRPGGVLVLEVPIGFGRRGADLWDFQSPQRVADLFRPCDVLWSETGPQIGAGNQRAARLVLRRAE